MKQSAKRMFSSLLALALFVGAIVVYFYLVLPAYNSIKELRKTAASKSASLEMQKKIISQVKSLLETYSEGNPIKNLANVALPGDPQIAEAIMQVNGIAQANNIVIKTMSVSEGTAPTKLSAKNAKSFLKNTGFFNMRIDASGSYEDFSNFLKNIETNIRIMDAKDFSVQQGDKPGNNLYSYSVMLTAYYQNK
jgi:Tfp pilus assembly protein PilO